MEWQDRFPDLNLIEHVRDIFGRATATYHPPYRIPPLDLRTALVEEWNLPRSYEKSQDLSLNSLVSSIKSSLLERVIPNIKLFTSVILLHFGNILL